MPFARSSGDCGYCSESLMTKSVSFCVDEAYSTSLIGPAISRSFSSGALVKVSTRRGGSKFGGPEGPKPTTPLTQPGFGYAYEVLWAALDAEGESEPSFNEVTLPDLSALRCHALYFTPAGGQVSAVRYTFAPRTKYSTAGRWSHPVLAPLRNRS